MAHSERNIVELTDDQLDAAVGGHHPHTFEIKDFSFGVSNPTTVGSTGGTGEGKIDFSGFDIKGK